MYNIVGYLRLYHEGLEIVEQSYDHLKLKGNLTGIVLLDKDNNELESFKVEACVTRVIRKKAKKEFEDVVEEEKK